MSFAAYARRTIPVAHKVSDRPFDPTRDFRAGMLVHTCIGDIMDEGVFLRYEDQHRVYVVQLSSIADIEYEGIFFEGEVSLTPFPSLVASPPTLRSSTSNDLWYEEDMF